MIYTYTILEGQIIFSQRHKEKCSRCPPESVHETSPFRPQSSAQVGDYFQGVVCRTAVALRARPKPLSFQLFRCSQVHAHIRESAASSTDRPQSSPLPREGDGDVGFGDNLFSVFWPESAVFIRHTHSEQQSQGALVMEGWPGRPLQAVHF